MRVGLARMSRRSASAFLREEVTTAISTQHFSSTIIVANDGAFLITFSSLSTAKAPIVLPK